MGPGGNGGRTRAPLRGGWRGVGWPAEMAEGAGSGRDQGCLVEAAPPALNRLPEHVFLFNQTLLSEINLNI